MIESKTILRIGTKVNVYFEIGKLLSLAGKEYGKNIIKQYSQKLPMQTTIHPMSDATHLVQGYV